MDQIPDSNVCTVEYLNNITFLITLSKLPPCPCYCSTVSSHCDNCRGPVCGRFLTKGNTFSRKHELYVIYFVKCMTLNAMYCTLYCNSHVKCNNSEFWEKWERDVPEAVPCLLSVLGLANKQQAVSAAYAGRCLHGKYL